MEMFKVGDEVELDLTSPMFEDNLLGTVEDELKFCEDFGLVPDKAYKVLKVEYEKDEDGEWYLLRLEGTALSWCNTRFKHAVTTLENE